MNYQSGVLKLLTTIVFHNQQKHSRSGQLIFRINGKTLLLNDDYTIQGSLADESLFKPGKRETESGKKRLSIFHHHSGLGEWYKR